jgi:hypothetical protein
MQVAIKAGCTFHGGRRRWLRGCLPIAMYWKLSKRLKMSRKKERIMCAPYEQLHSKKKGSAGKKRERVDRSAANANALVFG